MWVRDNISPWTFVFGCGKLFLDTAELLIPGGAVLIGRDGR